MTVDSLHSWTQAMRSSWHSGGADLIGDCRRYLKRLAQTSPAEEWLAEVRRGRPATRELYRDPDHGFVLLAHSEQAGLYRPPHDHGRSWVAYAVLEGEVEMGSFDWATGPSGEAQIIKRSTIRMRGGDVEVYLPGDIHDTLCVAGPALLLRFTERDLQVEKLERRLTRYARQGDLWLAEVA